MTRDKFWSAVGAAVIFVAAGFVMTTVSIATIEAAMFTPGPMCHSAGCYTVAAR
ncbi:MAG: hypothetical protein AAGG72_05000 [Pseudomonadota bacterium]